MQRRTSTIFFLALPLATSAAALSQTPAEPDLQRAAHAVKSLRGAMTAPIVDESEGEVRARLRDQRVRFDADGMTILPVFGAASPHEWPIDVTVAGATVAGEALDVQPARLPEAAADRVVVDRAGLRGVHHLGLDGVEQTFEFDTLPVRGELTLRLDVDTDLTPVVDGDALRFTAGELGHVEVGSAFAFDATGRRIPIAREWTGDGIDLRVPAAFVQGAVLPLTIDPVWSTFVNTAGTDDDAMPDVAFCAVTQEYILVWEDWTSQSNSDIAAIKLDTDLVPTTGLLFIEATDDSWQDPAVAYVGTTDHAVVVASVGLGTAASRIMARTVDVANWQVESAFNVSSIGNTQKKDPDVGGMSIPTPNVSANFCVIWTREMAPGDHDVEYRVFGTDGTPRSDVTAVDTTAVDDIHPCISPCLGDTEIFGDYWNIAWTSDDDGDGLGKIRGHRVLFTGAPQPGVNPFDITNIAICSYPSVTSTLDDVYFGARPFLCAYERHNVDLTRPNGLQTDIDVLIIVNEQSINGSTLTLQEDGPRGLLQVRPSIVTNGEAFALTYLEEESTALNQGRWNAYMCTGELRLTVFGTGLPLAERHVPLGTTADIVSPIGVALRWSGDASTTSNEGFAVWSRFNGHPGVTFGRLEGAGIDYLIPSFLTAHAVGVQYGNANVNSTGNRGWLRILGDQSTTNPHLAQAIDLPQNAFGYLVVGTVPTNVDMPGGSAGRLLVGGNVGRYVNSIQSSGQLGRIDVAIDPTSIPQANGSVAAVANTTYYFQMWHRDSVNGQPTSNFTNGARVFFTN